MFIIAQGKENAMGNAPNEWLSAVALKDWMDAVVDLKQQEIRLKMFGNQLLLLDAGGVAQVYSLIGFMACAAGAELKEEIMDREYPFKYSFTYRGIQFFQLSEERLEGYVCAD